MNTTQLRIFLIILVLTIGCSSVKIYPPELDSTPVSSIQTLSGKSVAILIVDKRVNREKSQEVSKAFYSAISRIIGHGSVHSVQNHQDAKRLGADVLLTVKINAYEANFTPGYWHGITDFDVQVFDISEDIVVKTFNVANKVDSFNLWGYKTARKALKQSFQRTIDDMFVRLEDTDFGATREKLTAAPSESAVDPTITPVDVDMSIPETQMNNPDAIAVVIGNRDYRHPNVPKVDFAIRDATMIKEYLIKTLGFKEGNILFYANATQAQFNALFGTEKEYKGRLFDFVKPGKSDVFIFYSGHGAPDPESEQGYFVPVDCDPKRVKLNGYSLNLFYQNISKIPANNFTIVIDTCFSGISQGGSLLGAISPIVPTIENPMALLPNATVMTAARGDEVSGWYPEKKHGLFTYFFLKGISGDADVDKNGELTVKELKQFLTDKTEGVPYWARRLHGKEQNPDVFGEEDKVLVKYQVR